MTIQGHTKTTLTVAIILLSIPIVAVIILLTLDWNRIKPSINAHVSEAIGRPFSIRGDLSLTWKKSPAGQSQSIEGWRSRIPWPYLLAQNIQIGNPPNLNPDLNLQAPNASSNMASIKQLTFAFDPLALVAKKIVIPILYLDTPTIALVRNAQAQNNWTLSKPDKASAWQLELQRIVLTKGRIHLNDALKRAIVTVDIETLNNDSEYGVEWQLHGKLNGEIISGNGRAGAVLALQQQTTPFPIMAYLRQGETVISVVGSVTRPTDLAAIDMRLALSGLSMARLYALTGIILPETPPFATEGHLLGTLGPKGSWSYQKFRGKVGSSDINGDLNFLLKEPRPLLSGSIVSESLLFSDLAPIIGIDSASSKITRGVPAIQPSDKILPIETFKTERWTSIDADIKFSANNIIRKEALAINKLTTKLHLQDGVLTLLPLNFELAGGSLSSDITLDGSARTGKNAIQAEMKIKARHLKLKQMFPNLQELNASLGEVNGDASLSAVGNSVASLLGASNGEVKALINQGTISKLLLEEIGLNIGSVVFTTLTGDKQVKLNCLAADFDVRNGLMQTKRFVVDTDEATLEINGSINLKQEQLDLSIKPKSKGVRVISLRAPIYVHGNFQHPSVNVDKGVMAMRAGGALALATLTPFAALIPLISTGQKQDSECATLLAEVNRKPVAPAPGKTKK
ncbi:AsmA family protein [Undibacterium sp. Ren11W]|uniref:AsmA family protein n=1 Tax=Undibacterium sp. Ren11W TaxID=3413045 RepID=UPI003BF1E744